jgi:uncharacterized membrane protein YeaQ/YmgE (transglycosylase-associated protein family)
MAVLFLAILAIVVLAVIGAVAFALALHLVWWAIIGLVFGALGRLVLPGRQPIGLLATALIGIAGSLLGGVVARAVHLGGGLQFVIAVAVSAALVAAYASRQSGSRFPAR